MLYNIKTIPKETFKTIHLVGTLILRFADFKIEGATYVHLEILMLKRFIFLKIESVFKVHTSFTYIKCQFILSTVNYLSAQLWEIHVLHCDKSRRYK